MKKNIRIILIVLMMLFLMLTGCGKKEENNIKQENKIYTQQELEDMAMTYHYELTGYKPQNVSSTVNEDGTISIQLYDDIDDHTTTCDWYTIDPKTGKGTNIVNEPVDLTIKPKRLNFDDQNVGTAEDVMCEINTTDEGKQFITVTATDTAGKTVWVYESQEYKATQLDNLEFIQTNDGIVYINEDGIIKTFDLLTGEMLWENNDYKGCGSKFDFDKDRNLYITGDSPARFCVIDKDGKTLKNVEKLGDDVNLCSSVKVEEDKVKITFQDSTNTNVEAENTLTIYMEDLKNKDNLTLKKEIESKSIKGFEDIEKFILDQNGTVTIKIKENTNLSKQYENLKNSYNACTQVKNMYLLPYGNGGYYELVMVKKDGSVYYLDSNTTKQSGKITIEQSSSKNIDFIMTKNLTGSNSILTVDKNGKGAELTIKQVSYTPKKDDSKEDLKENLKEDLKEDSSNNHEEDNNINNEKTQKTKVN